MPGLPVATGGLPGRTLVPLDVVPWAEWADPPRLGLHRLGGGQPHMLPPAAQPCPQLRESPLAWGSGDSDPFQPGFWAQMLFRLWHGRTSRLVPMSCFLLSVSVLLGGFCVGSCSADVPGIQSWAGAKTLSRALLETAGCGGIPAHSLTGRVTLVYYVTWLASVSLYGWWEL